MSPAEQRRGHRSLARRHPVVVAAQRVDLAVMRDVAVRMRQRPGREGVGRETLVHQGERALEVGIVQVRIIGAELVGQEHALVDHRAAGDRHRVIAGRAPLAPRIDGVGDRLAQDVEPALELGFGVFLLAETDEHLQVHRFGRLDRLAERRIVGRHLAPAEQRQPLARDHLGIDVADDLPPIMVARHEQIADRVFARLRQLDAELGGLLGEKLVRDLHQDAGAVAHARIGADRAAMLQIAENAQTVFDDLVRLAALDVGDEADAAGVLVERRIVQAMRGRRAGIGGGGAQQRGVAGLRRDPAFDKFCAASVLAHLILPRRRPRPPAYSPRPQAPIGAAVNAQPISRRAALHGRRRRGCSRWAPPMSAPSFKGRHRAASY